MLSDGIKPLQDALDGIVTGIRETYFRMEDYYYKLADEIEEKYGVPVFENFIKPIEEKGIPSFSIVLLFILLLLAGSLVLLLPPQSIELGVFVYGKADKYSEPLDGALVEVTGDSGLLLSGKTMRGRASFHDVPPQQLTISVTKEGFEDGEKKVDLEERGSVRITLQCSDQKICDEIIRRGMEAESSAQSSQNQTQKVYLPPKKPKGGGEVRFEDEDPEATIGRLLIIARDAQGEPVDAKAKIYDYDSAAEIGEVEISGGSGLAPGLPVGKTVYANVIAEGYVPYEGKGDAFAIRGGTNKLKVVLRQGGFQNVQFVVVDRNNTAVDYAEVSTRSLASPEVLERAYTDSEGKASAEVGAAGGYYAVVSKEGYVTNYTNPFKGGETVKVILSKPSEVPVASLEVAVEDEKGAKAYSAEVVVLQKTRFGALFVLKEGYADSNGKAVFSNIEKGVEAEVRATSSDLYANASIVLSEDVNKLKLILKPKPFFVKAYAYDPMAKKYVDAASFVSSFEGKEVGACSGKGCSLKVLNNKEVVVKATAEGHSSATMSFYVYEGGQDNVTLYMVNLESLKDSFIQWAGLFDGRGKLLPAETQLKPGHSYQARLQLVSKNADSTGVVFNTGNDEVYLTKHEPPGSYEKGAYADSCYASDLKYDGYTRYSRADIAYSGEFSATAAFNFTIDPAVKLEEKTKTKVLALGYRSYLKRGADYVRNPFDPDLLNKPSPDHPSGCYSPSYTQNYTIKSSSATCSKEGCVSVSFIQGEESGADGFTARNKVLLWNEKDTPLNIVYGIELFENFESGSFRLEAPERNAVMWNATTPILGDSPVAQGKKSCDILKGKAFAVNGNNFTIDFAELKKCSNFAIPMRFEGVAVSRALGAGDADVKGTLTTGAKSVAHTSRMTVEGFGVEADENAIIEARMHQENNVMPDAEPFPALTTSNCTAAEATGGQCDAGALNVTFRLTALKEGAYSLGTSSVLLNTPISVSPNSKSLKKLESVQGEAFYLVPIEKGEGAVDVSAGSLKLQRNVTVGGEGFAKNETNVFPAGWDTCNGFIEIKYEPAKNPPFTLGKGCTDLGFRVSTIFPADAVFMNMSIPEYGNVITRSVESDGSDKCYEVCEIDKKGEVYGCEGFGKQMYSGSQYLVRYSPETRGTCDKKFKARGNKISGSQVKIEFAYTGDATAKRSLVLHVFNDQSEKSLYISPVYSLYGTKVGGGVETLYPQLWAVTNLKQLGKRSIVFMKPSNMLISFEGPGTKLFAAYYPPATAQKQMVAYESTDLEKPIFAFGDTSSEVKPISRYGEALVAKQQQFEVDSPQAQALSELLQASLSENAFLQKDAADSLSTAVQRLAKRTVYWRSNDVTRVCQQTPECVSSYYTLEGCCRDSVEEWKNYTTKIIYNKQSCVFCNNTKNPDCNNATVQHLSKHQQCTYQPSPSVYQCDQRCSAKAVLTPETIASLNQIELGGTGVTINAMSGAKLPYGESIEGRKCTLEYASTNAFSLASDALASRQYAPYNPKRPKEKITVDEIEKCISNGNCPLVLIDYFDQTTQSPRKAPQCTEDKNADGLMEEGEQLHNATYASPQALGIQTGTYTCASPRVVAVDKAAFFAPALQGDKITPKTEISDFEVEYCQLGACPLVLAPQSASTLTGSRVVCFRDVNGNGFVDESINSEMNSMEPAQPMSWTYAFQRHTCPQGKQIAVIKFCLTSCGSYCYTPNCDPDLRCKPSGTKDVPTTEQIREFKGWLNQSSVAQVKIEGKRLSRGRAFLPAAWFQDLYGHADGKPVFSHSFVVNSKKAAAELASLSTVSEVIGCGPGSDYPYDASLHTNEGVYEVRDFNVIDARGESWSAQANAMTLPVTNYLAETKADTCRKTRWDARLCERSYPDKSPEYGACFNSILQFQASAKKLGAEAGADLVGGLGYGVKNGLGYGVAPNGHVFALLEPGTTDYTCRGENKWKIERQRLYHWTPVGKPETQQFQWETDLGCNGDCGCKSGGGYGSVLGILGAIVGIFCPVCGAIIGAVGQVVDSGAGGGGGGGGGFMGAVTDGVVQTISSGAIGLNCKQWGPFGEAVVYACKGLVWQISGAG